MPSISKQNVMRSVKEQSQALWVDIKHERLQIEAKMDIDFTTEFWISPASKNFMTMSMHWITRYWRLKMRILGIMHFAPKHSAANIPDHPLNTRIHFGVRPKDAEGRIPES